MENNKGRQLEIIERYCPKAGGNVVLERYIYPNCENEKQDDKNKNDKEEKDDQNDNNQSDEDIISQYYCLHSQNCESKDECDKCKK